MNAAWLNADMTTHGSATCYRKVLDSRGAGSTYPSINGPRSIRRCAVSPGLVLDRQESLELRDLCPRQQLASSGYMDG
jgi:hypothetical protein